MREHMGLYRGKRTDNGEWVKGNLVDCPQHFRFKRIVNFGCLSAGVITRWEQDVITETVGECTGLTDKNGKLIFEGDIVKHCNDNPYCELNEIGRVFWDETYCGWRRTSNGAFHNGKIDTYRMSYSCVYEIIGNVHDNPELLEGAGDDA